MSAEKIVEAYADAEVWLLRLITDAARSGATGTENYYRHRLDALRRADRYMTGLESHLEGQVFDTLVEGWKEGVVQASATMGAAVPPPMPTAPLALLTEGVTAALTSQRPMILRVVDDMYREVVQTVTTRSVLSGMNIDRAMQETLNLFASRGITSFTDNAGRRWGMDTYTRMALRTARNRVMNEGRQDLFRSNGVDLILVSWHRACSPMCLPYQGRILTLDGAPGRRVVENRVEGGEMVVDVVERRDVAISNGFLHPNCRHTESAYIPGIPVPEVPDVDEEEHEVEQRQRAIERHIRHWKKREAVALTPQERVKAQAKVKAWQKAQRDHVKRHSFLRRNYSREKVWTGNAGSATPRLVAPTPSPIQVPVVNTPTITPTDFYQHQTFLAGTVKIPGTDRGLTLDKVRRTTKTTGDDIVPTGAKASTVNPGYATDNSAYRINCVRVSNAVELRRRGYDVTAGPGSFDPDYRNPGTTSFMRQALDERRATTARNAKARIDNADVAMTGWRTEEGAVRIPQSAPKSKKGLAGGQNAATLDMFENGVPDGARGFAVGNWDRGGAHIWNWEKSDGRISFYEAQAPTGAFPNEKYLDRLKRGSLRMVRVDDLTPTDDILKVIDHDPDRF